MSTLESIKGIGPRMKEKLNRNNIYDCFDLMYKYPSRYVVYQQKTLKDTIDNETVTLRGTVISKPIVHFIRRNLTKLQFKINIEERIFTVVIFNREYLSKMINVSEEVVVTGKIEREKYTFNATTLKLLKNYHDHIEAIYNIENITDQQFNKYVQAAIVEYSYLLKEDLPQTLIDKYKLITFEELIKIVHNPGDLSNLKHIDRRIKYEELFKFQMKMNYMKLKAKSKKVNIKKYDINSLREYIKKLPFTLTDDQKHMVNEIIKDIKSPYMMNRLLQGDTGSGKTVVASIAAYAVILSGYQVAFMAPTEILAKQHYQTFTKYFNNLNVNIVLLTGKIGKQERTEKLNLIITKPNTIIIGTHALFSDDVVYNNLGFVITDEQHRFGVNQRKKMREKGFLPDVLYMSATPIPRTLAISFFGDMDVSIIKQKPEGRKKVVTKLFTKDEMDLVYDIIHETLLKKEQVYIVTPLILESETLDLSNASQVFQTFRKQFKDFNTGLIHSKISSDDKDIVMENFNNGLIDILVSTTVIEVGVDNKNASLIVILDAERFGLSQLHQLRGRVGRGEKPSNALLVYNKNTEAKERLEILEKTDDGFVLSEHDLRLRGPGEFFGFKQTGDLKFLKADLLKDYKILELAREDAIEILTDQNSYYNKLYTPIFKYLKKELRNTKLD
ncbi:hypothetical protein CI105_07890 [Candidatus Izimaplasma bacterium ZiA1]|uniref:ATP-dependent DNA helicase RecG n=1 Tax=Candidatus Izimoplasma sp. ZiA1 TaxID=2024899 RepID=UPI000BAA3C2E|nr:hypothetical protein CI105_07890 [Candidatus Izimaplasma bacterium ZiA1]